MGDDRSRARNLGIGPNLTSTRDHPSPHKDFRRNGAEFLRKARESGFNPPKKTAHGGANGTVPPPPKPPNPPPPTPPPPPHKARDLIGVETDLYDFDIGT